MMTEFGAAASSSSSSVSKWPYHVFLSFRGEDTRYGFTGNLYHALCGRGIRTFIDDEGIRKGDEITPTLLKKIKESKTAIVVFSKDYASSTFCLKELAQILDCMKEPNDRFIWPVFYDVDPSDIRHQTGSYKEAFDRYEGVKDETTVKRWRLALTEAADMSGWPFDPRSELYQYKIIDEIVQEVSKVTRIGFLHVARFPVGLQPRVDAVCSLLNKEPHCDGATIVGIFGVGGIGKSTIARATYNEIAINFKHKCFLNDIKERSICEVQGRLLSELLSENINLEDYNFGISVIKDRLLEKKVLLVLDDISTQEQLGALAGESNWFGYGSKIIITTRDKSLLQNLDVKRIYEVPELSDREARQLLILNAFKKEEEDPEYKEVINRAVKYGFGLPLALETFGSTFGRHKTVKEMESFLDIREKFPNKTILQILKVSYDSLEELYKEVFLDIACFYRGYSLRYATEILSARYGIDSEYCINILIVKSLVKLGERGHFNMYDPIPDERGYLNMHDLIQEMGQEIVRQESPDVGQRSRLWSKEDILQVLNENTGTGKVQGMVNSLDYETVEWSGEAFEKMKNLRVLCFSSGIRFSQGPKCLPNSLRVVEWDYYPSSTLPDDFCPINLVVLRLRRSCLKTLGKACKNFYNLRKLDLQRCENLEELPDISGIVNLEELNVSYCKKLTKIDDSVGYLSKLRLLVARKCMMLDTFIVRGIKLVSIEIINLRMCLNLKNFSEILAPIENIKTLDLSHTAIKTLPKSIENFISLQALYLNFCGKLRQLPNLACLHNLKTLDLDVCSALEEITEIPPNIEVFSAKWCRSLTSRSTRLLSTQKFFNLVKLNLQKCDYLEELPDISGAAGLEELDVSFCSKLTKIDDSIGYLAKLRVLDAEFCEILDTFIVGGIKLVSLETLNLKCCDKLHTFPEILGSMENIIRLDLGHTAIKLLPESMEKLVALERLCLRNIEEDLREDKGLSSEGDLFPICMSTLFLDGCEQLQEIRKIPPNIKVLFAENCKSLTSCLVRALLKQELQETRMTQFILPGIEIPNLLHKHSTGGSVSFWVRKKISPIALCAVVTGGPTIFISFVMDINGVTKHVVRREKINIKKDNIFLFDLRHFEKKVASGLLEKEWNHVEFSLEGGGTESRLKYFGIYVYNYDSCKEDILFENPIPQERIQVEAVHKIGDSNLVSSSGDNNEEDDKLDNEIMDLSTETVSNIEKKGQLMVDDVNLTLSLALPEPSNDTTSHHDDKLNKEIMDSSPKAESSLEKKKRKLKMDDENFTSSLALPEPSSDTTSRDDMQQQQHLSSINQQISESSEIIKKAKGKDIIVYEGNTNEEKGGNTLEVTYQNYRISSNSESLNWDPMRWEHQLMGQKDQRTIIDQVHDERASHYSKDLQQQQHLTSIHQQIPKSFENVKKAKGKDIMVYGGNSNEKQCSNTSEGQLEEFVHRQTQEEELYLANDKFLTPMLGQRMEYFQDKDYGARSPSKRTSDQITVDHFQEQKKKIREEVVVEVREEMRVEFEKRLASLFALFHQGQISRVFPTVTPNSPREPPT